MNIQDDVQEYVKRKQAGLYALLLNWSQTLENYSRQNAPWRDRLGHARQGLHSGVDRFTDRLVLYLSHGMRYGEHLEKGTGIYGPHGKPIVPVNKKALYGPGLNHPVKKIKGMKPRPIVKPTVENHKRKIGDSIREYWRD